jgi:hypothetical protein
MKAAKSLVVGAAVAGIIAGAADLMEPGAAGSEHIQIMPATSLVEVLDTDGRFVDPNHATMGSPGHLFM